MLLPIEMIQYDPQWPWIYAQEVVRIQLTWGGINLFHHVGSTAVPGLAAKPKIDMLGVVSDLCFDGSILVSLGYQDRGGFNLPSRRSFTLRAPSLQVNLHVFEEGDPEIEANLLFRDALRQDPVKREAYAALKQKILLNEMAHQKASVTAFYREYTLQKQDFIHGVLKQTGFQRERWVLCSHTNEWNAAKRFHAIAFPEKDPTRGSKCSCPFGALSRRRNHGVSLCASA